MVSNISALDMHDDSKVLDKSEINESLDLESSAPVSDNDSIQSRSDGSNLIINYLPYSFTDSHLWGLFAEYGRVIECKVIKDKYTQSCKGYGFVRYTTQDEAEKAIKEKNGFVVENKILKVSFARDPSEDIMNCKIYVSNISKQISKKDCESLFSKYGEIIELRFVPSSKGKKSIAFVQYALKSQAENAIAHLNGFILPQQINGLILKFVEKKRQQKKSKKKLNIDGSNAVSIVTRSHSTLVPPPPGHDQSFDGQYVEANTYTPNFCSIPNQQNAVQMLGYGPYCQYPSPMDGIISNSSMMYMQFHQGPSVSTCYWQWPIQWNFTSFGSESIYRSGPRDAKTRNYLKCASRT